MTVIHEVAQLGFGTGTNELYDRIRPSYQPWALSHIRSAVKSPSPLNIAEIGSGTGIFTRALLNHPEWKEDIKSIKAIEPSEGMREVFTKSVQDPRVTTANGTFDTTGVEDGWADVVIVAQAFHWCPDYEKAAIEFNRILKPHGVVALIWNLEDRDAARWTAQVRDTIEVHEKGTPQFRLNLWRKFFEEPSYLKHFKAPEEKVWTYNLEATVDTVVDRASSKSYIAVLPPDEKRKVQDDVRKIIDRGDDLTWIDKDKGVFNYPYKTWVVISKKN